MVRAAAPDPPSPWSVFLWTSLPGARSECAFNQKPTFVIESMLCGQIHAFQQKAHPCVGMGSVKHEFRGGGWSPPHPGRGVARRKE